VRSGWFRGLTAAGLPLAAAGLALRTSNAFRYPTVYGFDSPENWRYIERLTGSWALPAPDADWSTAHPPLFYYACAALCRALGLPEQEEAVIFIRLISSILGLFAVGLAVGLVRRADPDNPARALLAGALLLFLPAHIYMSAMLHEEILVSSLISLVAVAVAYECMSPERPRRALHRAAGWGVAAGLALLTKLTGLLVVLAAAGAYAVDGWRRRDWALAAATSRPIATSTTTRRAIDASGTICAFPSRPLPSRSPHRRTSCARSGGPPTPRYGTTATATSCPARVGP
jgi:putative effector of murein hydrolase LrgA (UPF0299 family)